MTTAHEHAVGMRELRHKTNEVMGRVRHGETIDVTEYGQLIARIVPVQVRDESPVLEKLAAEGRLRRASRPGFRPPMLPSREANELSDGLQALRDEESW